MNDHAFPKKPAAANASAQNVALPSWVFALAVGLLAFHSPLRAVPPRYDHVVIVVEENRTPGEIIGDLANAPYITSLATGGVYFSSLFALQHPSQPNYLHLFSGDNQGVTDDGLPSNFSTNNTSTYPFKTSNLGAELISQGFTFAGFSEQLEAAGTNDWADFDPHSDTYPGVKYRRKHNPWANWVAKLNPIPANQLTSSVNRAFTQFPTNYALLPTVSFVIPNQDHDMHDGSRRAGDDWLKANLSAYATWARTNNSLLIVTWDEDDYNSVNQIPTVFYGANLRNGTVIPGTWTLHNLLRTIEDMYGTSHAGSAAQVRSFVGPFQTDPTVIVQKYRQGLLGYAGAQDTQLLEESPTASYATTEDLTADLDSSSTTGNQMAQVLVRFNSLFGTSPGQVPTNAIIHSAKLILFTPISPSGLDYDSDDTFRLHRMIADWNDTATWNSFSGGVNNDGVEAAGAATFSLVPEVDGAPAIFDVTSDIDLFRTGTPNRGWVIRPSTSGIGNGWTLKSSETTADQTQRPTLEIVYSLPSTPYNAWAASNNLGGADALANADPDHDGVSNLLEFAYNLNPKLPDAAPLAPNGTAGLPAAHYLTTSGGVLEIEFLRRKGPTAAGLTYTAQFTDSLGHAWVNGQAPVVTSISADWERVTVRDSLSGPNPMRFGKIVVGLQ